MRFQNLHGVNCNAQMTPSMIKEFCVLDGEGSKLFEKAYDRFRYSARSFHKFLKVSRTFADIDGSEKILKTHVAKTLMCRDLDKERANMMVV